MVQILIFIIIDYSIEYEINDVGIDIGNNMFNIKKK